MNTVTHRPTYLVHGYYAIAIDASRAAHAMREVLPHWNPWINPGFQGRQLIVLSDRSRLALGRPTKDRTRAIFAVGTDGEVRQSFNGLRADVDAGHIAITDASRPATVETFDAVMDLALAHAMPLSYIEGIERGIAFQPTRDVCPRSANGKRLADYVQAGIAPAGADDGRARPWHVSLALTPIDRLYAMCEVYGGLGIDRPSVSLAGGDAAFLIDGYAHWFREHLVHAA
ncbi:hypothetical protein [Rhodanobacter denitrificans]|uniref:Uncharacterized protein n=1 Tax=Rhodanobacter denitrificans TaxID=666685 RepID=M4NG24_9GAMM|nr:hypothetical protein [Rhodanobacter denitrificans]AGG89017.1 hypothetical protein R2APBS1_1893 [Rhodanobacter denitrificans]UJJ53046.1 hypothetical protein LRK52_18230 [Rhodanobacter denitrificans]